MIIVFLIVLIIALVLANLLVSVAREKKNEKGFAYPAENTYEPEVIRNDDYQETAIILQGAVNATNKKIELLNQRLSTLEKVVLEIVDEKVKKTETKSNN
jgi:hypothetical protein